MNKLLPIRKAELDEVLSSLKVYLKEFKKTPNRQLAERVSIQCITLRNKMDYYIKEFKKEDGRELKVNGVK